MAGLRTHTLVTRFMPYSTKGRLPCGAGAGPGVPRVPPAWWLLGKQTLYVGVAGLTEHEPPRSELSVVMPVFNEGEAVEPVLRALTAASPPPHEILVVYDFDEDPTVPVIARLAGELPAVRGLRNDLGRGVLNAMKAGIAESRGARTS